MFCSKCGKEIALNDTFCSNCGYKCGNENTQQNYPSATISVQKNTRLPSHPIVLTFSIIFLTASIIALVIQIIYMSNHSISSRDGFLTWWRISGMARAGVLYVFIFSLGVFVDSLFHIKQANRNNNQAGLFTSKIALIFICIALVLLIITFLLTLFPNGF